MNSNRDFSNTLPLETGAPKRPQPTDSSATLRRNKTQLSAWTALPVTGLATFVLGISPLSEPAWWALARRLQVKTGPNMLDPRMLPGANTAMRTAGFIVVVVLGLALFPHRRITWLVVSAVACAAVGAAVRSRNLHAFEAVATFIQLILLCELTVLVATALVRRHYRTGDTASHAKNRLFRALQR